MKNVNKYYVKQNDENDCGIAALSMILRYFGSQYSFSYLRDSAKTDSNGTSIFGIIQASKNVNLDAKAIKVKAELLSDVDDIPYPYIIHVRKENYLHYYVVFSVDGETITIGDPNPEIGITKMSRESLLHECTGYAIFFNPLPKYKPYKQRQPNLYTFLKKLKKYKKSIVVAVTVSSAISLITILGSIFMQSVIDYFVPHKENDILALVVGGLILSYVIQGVLSYAQSVLMLHLSKNISEDVLLGFVRHVLRLPMKFFSTRRTGEIVSRFNDAYKVIDALTSIIMIVFLDTVMLATLSVFMWTQSEVLFLVEFVSFPIYVVVIFLFKSTFEKKNQQSMQSNAMLDSSFIESVQGIETIKALNSEKYGYKRIEKDFESFFDKSISYSKTSSVQQIVKNFIQLVLNVFVIWKGIFLVQNGTLSLGQLVMFESLTGYFVSPLQNIINLQEKIQSADVAITRLNDVTLVDAESSEAKKSSLSAKRNDAITYHNVKFSYGFSPTILNGVNLEIKKNSKVSIVGMSGSGKSTLMKLLVRFWDCDSGEICIGDTNIKEITQQEIRRLVQYIPQRPFFFSGTIRENLLLGSLSSNVNDTVIKRACTDAEIYQDIEQMPAGIDTYLSENGSALSEGQKQRLAIARSLLSGSEILIFDESTSNLDAITEKKVINNLIQRQECTIIFIAHRLSVAQLTDQIIVLDKGRVVERGTHSELMNKKEEYYKLITNL